MVDEVVTAQPRSPSEALEKAPVTQQTRQASEEFPRVLIVYLSCINEADQHGMSLRNWFAEWPKQNLAQIYSGNERGTNRFCGHTYKLGPSERRFGRLFFRLKASATADGGPSLLIDTRNETGLSQLNRGALIRHQMISTLVDSGLWEYLFAPMLSPQLMAWLHNFQPQIIYCQGYDLSFTWLPLMLRQRLDLPICFQTTDDWPTYLYRDSVAAWIVRPFVERAARQLITTASVRFSIGPAMAVEYSARYGVPVEPLMQCDNIERFRSASPRRITPDGVVSIVYTGNLAFKRWSSLLNICLVASALQQEGLDIFVTAFTTNIPPEAVNTLRTISNLQILPPPSHEEVPSFLKGADILFLPEPFDPVEAEAISLSISTKAHLYMMSERPILVYGSPVAGVVDYAAREGWAYVVDRDDQEALAQAMRSLVKDHSLCQNLIRRATEVALRNHDERSVRARFLKTMQDLADPVEA